MSEEISRDEIAALLARESEETIREEAKGNTFDILRFIADNAWLSIYEVILKAYNMGVSEQEAKTGHWKWISYQNSDYGDVCCSECRCVIVECILPTDMTIWGKGYKYCPNCGAKMESEEKV